MHLKSVFMFSRKESMRSSICGGMSCHEGYQVSLTYNLGGCSMKSVLSSSAKIVFRWRSRRSRERVALILFWVNFGVWMNLNPRPRAYCACGGTILPSVRSWKARLEISGRGDVVSWEVCILIAF